MLHLRKIRIYLDETEYQAGDPVKGEVVFECDKSFECNGIHLTFTGREHTKIVISTGKTTHVYTDELVFFSARTEFEREGEIPSGEYRYPFEFIIPDDGPTSYDGRYGWIEYKLKALVEISWAADTKDEVHLNVKSSRIIPASESARDFVEKDGYSILDVELEKSAIYLGDTIRLKFRVGRD
ncbi:MAG: sporulation protein, partial [Candidatus Thorarchaeota archaeon]